MNRRRIEQSYVAALAVIVVVAVSAFIWPNYRRAAAVAVEIASLEGKIGRLEIARGSLDAQSAAVASLKTQRAEQCRVIPGNAQVASLVRVLSLDPDGSAGIDQTFKVSGRRENVDGDHRFDGLALTVELDATFQQICELIDRCARLKHLVRVTGLDVARSEDDSTRLRASLSIDAIYRSKTPVDEEDTP